MQHAAMHDAVQDHLIQHAAMQHDAGREQERWFPCPLLSQGRCQYPSIARGVNNVRSRVFRLGQRLRCEASYIFVTRDQHECPRKVSTDRAIDCLVSREVS